MSRDDLDPEVKAVLREAERQALAPFNAPEMAKELAAETPVAIGGSRLYVFQEGAYRPGGERDLKNRISSRLGSEWKKLREAEILGFLNASSPELEERPPLDRINVTNGILNLKTGKLDPHSPVFLSPVQIAARYDPKASCPAIEKFLREVLTEDLIPIVYELVGYLLTPDQRFQKAVMLLGSGANGKSTLLNTIIALLGRENVCAVPLQQLDENQFAVAELYGRLACIAADLDARSLRSSSTFKGITGGDLLQGERKHRDPFTFRPYARLIYSANEVPPTPDSSDAFFRRWLILPFEKSFKGNADRRLLRKLTTPEELSGLLNLGLAALPGLHARGGFSQTQTTRRAAARFRIDSDSVAGFVDERAVVELDARIRKADLYSAYRGWCLENGRQALSAVRFNRRLLDLIGSDQLDGDRIVGGHKTWAGVRLEGASNEG